jgi:uncharacterized repeat protein (TIGR01451 family)
MNRRLLLTVTGVFIILTIAPAGRIRSSAENIATPILKWQNGGCYRSWCETGWYSSPAVADLDNDGSPEVAASPYTLFVLNGEDGSIQWQADPPGGRTWPGVVTADIDDDGDLELVVAQGGGYVTVYDHNGNQVWTQRPSNSELRGLSVYDLENDGSMEIIVTAAVGSRTNTWVLEHDGSLRVGWPQLNNESGYAWGTYNDNAAIGDMDGDGLAEIVVPSDVHYINAYEDNGQQIQAHSMYGDKGWGKVGVHVDHGVDLRGYAHCGTEHRPNFAHTPATLADVNGDGSLEAIVTGNVYNCGTSPYSSLYEMPFIFNSDRSRWRANGFDWEVIPVPDGSAGPLLENYNVIESAMANPVVADLDGDGFKEILFASYDGRLHVYWLDKTEHHNWPYNVSNTGPGMRFASEPVVVDLDNNGLAEVIFASWPQKGSGYVGKLHILDYRGNGLHEVPLPAPFGSPDWNGVLGAPTIADIDGDADMELVLNTSHSGIVAYDLPGTDGARIVWGTGRGNYQRTGSYLVGSLSRSHMKVAPRTPGPGDAITYTIELINSGPSLDTVTLTNAIPVEVTYGGNLSATSGIASYAAGQVTWDGSVEAGKPVTITFSVIVNGDLTDPLKITSIVHLNDGMGTISSLSATTIANGLSGYLPLIAR